MPRRSYATATRTTPEVPWKEALTSENSAGSKQQHTSSPTIYNGENALAVSKPTGTDGSSDEKSGIDIGSNTQNIPARFAGEQGDQDQVIPTQNETQNMEAHKPSQVPP